MKSILFLAILFSSLFSHPHTFIEVHSTLKVKNDSEFTLNFKWVLDDMTSTILIMELDTNADGTIQESENKYIYKEYFSMFREYDYYTYLKVKGKPFTLGEPKNFHTTIENNRICYSFDIEVNAAIKDTLVEFGDKSYYVAMVLKKEFVVAEGYETQVTRIDTDEYYGFSLAFK